MWLENVILKVESFSVYEKGLYLFIIHKYTQSYPHHPSNALHSPPIKFKWSSSVELPGCIFISAMKWKKKMG